jgi:hypothetical protein
MDLAMQLPRSAPVRQGNVSFYDYFGAGIGFDIAGSWLLARGLLIRPSTFARRLRASRNTSSWWNVSTAEGQAYGWAGLVFLLVGFGLQALGYALAPGRSYTHPGAQSRLILGILAAAPLVLVALFAKQVLWSIERPFLIGLAHYRTGMAEPEPTPDTSELVMYGDILRRPKRPDEDDSAYLRRVWRLKT